MKIIRKIEVSPNEALYPVPVVLVTCFDREADRPNAITIAWCGIAASNPPSLYISIRPSRHSHKLILSEREFVVNIPSKKMLKEVDLCGILSGRDTDKFKLCNFTAVNSTKISAPRIDECPVNIECKLQDVVKLGTHDMFIANIVSVHKDESISRPDGSIDFKKADPIIFNQGEYWGLDKKIGYYGCSSKKETSK